MTLIRQHVGVANANVKTAVAAKDVVGWWRTHDAYVAELTRAQGEIENACGDLMMETLAADMPLNPATLEAIDLASAQAANYARHRVIVQAYGRLTREGVAPEKRGEALALLARQGIYEQDAGASGVATSPGVGPTPPSIADNPMHGKIAGTPQAQEILGQWQSTVMKVQAAGQRVAALETEVAEIPAKDPRRPKAEQRLAASRQQYENLLRMAESLRKKYYAAGGR
jgi:alkylhydroperoxidase/carboxymuconolactone decarboxylase family protein YurZ